MRKLDMFLLQSVIAGMASELEAEVNNLNNPAIREMVVALSPTDVQGYGAYTFVIKLDLDMKTSVVNLMHASTSIQLKNDIDRFRSSICDVRWIEDAKVMQNAGPTFSESTSLILETQYPTIRTYGISACVGTMVAENINLVSAYLNNNMPTRESIMFGRDEVQFSDNMGGIISMIVDHGVFLFENGIRLLIQEWNPDGTFQLEQQLDYMLYRSAKNDSAIGAAAQGGRRW